MIKLNATFMDDKKKKEDKYALDEYQICHDEDEEFVFTGGRTAELESSLDEDLDHDTILTDDNR